MASESARIVAQEEILAADLRRLIEIANNYVLGCERLDFDFANVSGNVLEWGGILSDRVIRGLLEQIATTEARRDGAEAIRMESASRGMQIVARWKLELRFDTVVDRWLKQFENALALSLRSVVSECSPDPYKFCGRPSPPKKAYRWLDKVVGREGKDRQAFDSAFCRQLLWYLNFHLGKVSPEQLCVEVMAATDRALSLLHQSIKEALDGSRATLTADEMLKLRSSRLRSEVARILGVAKCLSVDTCKAYLNKIASIVIVEGLANHPGLEWVSRTLSAESLFAAIMELLAPSLGGEREHVLCVLPWNLKWANDEFRRETLADLDLHFRATGWVQSNVEMVATLELQLQECRRVLAESLDIKRRIETYSSGDFSPFAAAVIHAVGASLAAVGRFEGPVLSALDECEQVTQKARVKVSSHPRALGIVDSLSHDLELKRQEAITLFEHQRDALSNVNIVLFGRTGTGKSSLIEALTHGNGATISTGESDFTTDIRTVTWHSCKIIDTPGTNGWSDRREILESRAQKAVEVADVVVLCFDTQSQQKGEFDKIADWVKDYGKPVLAVLNVRNQLWRNSLNVPQVSRRKISKQVRDHAVNIGSELSALGLFGVPIVAINSQKASYAHAREPYEGPLQTQFEKVKADLGPEALLRLSNLEAFQGLLSDSLSQHAVELRLGMLNAQVRTLISGLADVLRDAGELAFQQAEALEPEMEHLFDILGYPPVGSVARDALPEIGPGEDVLSWLELMRGGPYDSNVEGKVARFARHRLEAAVTSARRKSLLVAEEAVVQAFEARQVLDFAQVSGSIFDSKQLTITLDLVIRDTAEYLRREIQNFDAADLSSVEAHLVDGPRGAGSIGSWRRKIGYAAGAGGILAGLASTLLALGAIDPEPVTKVLLMVGSMAAAVGLPVIGTSQRRRAERERQEAWAEAMASVRRHVHKEYDGLTQRVLDWISSVLLDLNIQVLVPRLVSMGSLRMLSTDCAAAAGRILSVYEDLPVASDPQKILVQVADELGNRLSLLGEDWVQDPTVECQPDAKKEAAAIVSLDNELFAGMFDDFRCITERFRPAIAAGAGTKWLLDLEESLSGDTESADSIRELQRLAEMRSNRVHIVGDYNSGKTSFIKRLLVDSGQAVPDSLCVGAQPTTDQVIEYQWGQVVLVDTPGLQNTTVEDPYWDSSTLVCLLSPNLLDGSTQRLFEMLTGDRSRGLVPKLNRSMLVIHRSDELGACPEAGAASYVALCARKRDEVLHALKDRGLEGCSASQVCYMAADPFQLAGDRRDLKATDFDRCRAWDGFAVFTEVTHKIFQFGECAVDHSLLEGGLARLSVLASRLEASRAQCSERQHQLGRLVSLCDEIEVEGAQLDTELRAKIERLIDNQVFGCLQRVLRSTSQEEIEETAKQLQQWWTIPAFQGDAERWQSESRQTIDAWFERGTDRIRRTLNSPQFQRTFAKSVVGIDPSAFSKSQKGWFGKLMAHLGSSLKASTRDMVYAFGKALGAKFRPWGAVNLAKFLTKVGSAVGVLAAALDLWELFAGHKNEKRRAEQRQRLKEVVASSSAEVLKSLTDGDEDSAGPLVYLRTIREYLGSEQRQIIQEREGLFQELASLESRQQAYAKSISAAWSALGFEEER